MWPALGARPRAPWVLLSRERRTVVTLTISGSTYRPFFFFFFLLIRSIFSLFSLSRSMDCSRSILRSRVLSRWNSVISAKSPSSSSSSSSSSASRLAVDTPLDISGATADSLLLDDLVPPPPALVRAASVGCFGILPLMQIFLARLRGVSACSPPPSLTRSSTSDGMSSIEPRTSLMRLAARCCCSLRQCISIETKTGSTDATKAVSASAASTARNLQVVHAVLPCVTFGSPSRPSHTSISTERQPSSSTRRYLWHQTRAASRGVVTDTG